jgi:hypothetical protein
MLDWYCVEYLYPTAFKKFNDVMFPNIGVLSLSTIETYDIKKLYWFFDKQGIYLTLETYNPNQWVFTISLSNGVVFGPTQFSKENRVDIEKDGFLECFKLLDKKLSHDK